MSNKTEKRISGKEIYNGKIVSLVCDEVELPNGAVALREVVKHIGAAAIIPLTDDGMVIMERQFRYPHGRDVLEIPAGKLNFKGEDPLECARRELYEETGATAGRYTDLGMLISSPAILEEKIWLYLAEELSFGERRLDEDEFIDVELIPLKALYEMVLGGEISDAKTQIAILKAAAMRPEHLK